MTSSVLCRYYLQGACAFGDKCRFSHSKEQDEPSQVCRFYLAGNCHYGDKCRYQHSKPGWSGKGQPAPASNYSAPSGVPRPPVGSGSGGNMVKLPSGASEFGMVEAAPNWDDYMTPDEMDEFEQWQTDQAMAAANRGSDQQGGGGEYDDGDIMDPAEIPLCNEYAAQGYCSAGEECCYIHGDVCETCGYYCIHPYNPDVTAHHQMVCSEAMAAAAGGADAAASSNSCNGSSAPPPPAKAEPPAAAAAAAAEDQKKDEEPAAAEEAESAKPDAPAAAAADGDAADAAADDSGKEKEGEAAAAEAAADEAAPAEGDAAAAAAATAADAADELADKLAETKVCKQHAIHPQNPKEAKAHREDCGKLAAKLAKRVRDSNIECGICLEKVMSKPEMSQRRFGLMACEHAFCLGCIRNWRATGEVDAKTALRTCPLCRTTTHFITPSTTWPETPADKEATVDAYKASMAGKDCIHFDFGDGTCPFSTSCFYRHAYRDGRLEEVQLRRAGNADGDVKVIAPVTLSSFLEASLTAQLALSSRRSRGGPQQRPQQQQQPGSSQQQPGEQQPVTSQQQQEQQQEEEQQHQREASQQQQEDDGDENEDAQ